MKSRLRVLNSVQYSIQLLTALILLYFTINSNTPERIIIPILLIIGWTLGFYQRRITRVRVNKLRRKSKESEFIQEK